MKHTQRSLFRQNFDYNVSVEMYFKDVSLHSLRSTADSVSDILDVWNRACKPIKVVHLCSEWHGILFLCSKTSSELLFKVCCFWWLVLNGLPTHTACQQQCSVYLVPTPQIHCSLDSLEPHTVQQRMLYIQKPKQKTLLVNPHLTTIW